MYKNSEGYADPTAGIALGRIMKEYRKSLRTVATVQEERPKNLFSEAR